MTQSTVTVAFVLALGLCAHAQDKPVMSAKDRTDTVKISLSGEFDLDYVWRQAEIVAFKGGVSGTSTPADTASENTFEGFVALRLNAELSDKVSAVLEFGTKRADAGAISVFGSPSGAGSSALSLQLREAYVAVQELFLPELQAQIGISTWNFDVRGKGQSMVFDPRHSQSFFRNVNPLPDSDATLGLRASDPEELEPVGIWLRYGREKLVLDLVVLPTVIEGGSSHNDEAFYAVDLFYKIDDKDSRFGLIASATTGPGHETRIFTYGGGFDYKGYGSFDLYGEIYFQRGTSGIGGINPTVDVSAYAYQVGIEYVVPGDAKSWIGANLTYFSGDNEANSKSSAFASYENVHDLMILEDMYLGFDWDTNYRAIKIMGGFSTNAGGKGNLRFAGIVGICQTAKAVAFSTIPVPETTHKLGNEADVTATLDFTKQLSLTAGVGFLWGSRVLEDSMGGQGVGNASLKTLLFTIGTDVKF